VIIEVTAKTLLRRGCCYCRATPATGMDESLWIAHHGIYACPEQSDIKPPPRVVRFPHDKIWVVLRVESLMLTFQRRIVTTD
jgi:hypothetical protein